MVGLAICIPVTGIYFTIAAFSRPFKEMYINILNVIIFHCHRHCRWHCLVLLYEYRNSMAFVIVAATCDTLVILVLVSIISHSHSFCRKVVGKV